MDVKPNDFFDAMLAVGQRASGMDEKVAEAMAAAGFSMNEIVDVLATSSWAAYQREFIRLHALPCSPTVFAVLRESFDAGEGHDAALRRVMSLVGRFGGPRTPTPASD